MMKDIGKLMELHAKYLAGNSDGLRLVHPGFDFSGTDFTNHTLLGSNLSRCNLSNCKMSPDCRKATFVGIKGTKIDFSQSDITDTDFQYSDVSGFNMIGALWNGQTVSRNPVAFQDGEYWCMVTDIMLQVGCRHYSIFEAMGFTEEDLKKLDPRSQDNPVKWWAKNKSRVQQILAGDK